MNDQKIKGRVLRSGAVIALLLILISNVHADAAGLTSGETILDTASQFKNNAYSAAIETGNFFTTGAVQAVRAFSTLTNSFSTQFENKEQALNQNTELDVAKRNLENSKSNVATMFFYIVSTFVVLFDAIVSIIYIVLLMLTMWVLFVGYAKFMIVIIDFISGRLEKRGIRK